MAAPWRDSCSWARSSLFDAHDCCYIDCPEEGTIHIGANGGDSHWICWVHYYKWNADRARFLADGGGCEMQRLGELLCDKCWDNLSL